MTPELHQIPDSSRSTMASKRKSTVPCMIPPKSKHLREEIVLGCLPELLPTIPEDSILSISSQEEEAQRTPLGSGREGTGAICQRRAHGCLPCGFETTDLNLLLNHLDNCHVDFHTHPIFYCLNCKVSLAKFEGLALHNAKTHPELHAEGSPGKALLQVTRREGALIVEQTLCTEREDSSESGISITKTPIMKMMVKGEHKKIIVSHTVEVQRVDKPNSDKLVAEMNGNAGRNLPPAAALLAGTGPVPVLTVPNTPGIPVTQARKPLWNSAPPSPDASHNLPKVMIPLSSIPTYDPAMDSSSFLKTSFGKFPYPTKAELCYLTVVSGFPEEQIKLWFTAQRLKQGISWSPEEIEDTRRRMFNTVFQAAPKASRRQSPHQLPQHCLSVQPASASTAYSVLPKPNTTGWKGGVIVTQPGLNQASALKQQSVVRAPPVSVRHGVITRETRNGLSSQKVESGSVSRANIISNHRPGEKTEMGSSSSDSASAGGATTANHRQNSSYSEASIVNLTNIVRKIDCNVNNRDTDCTSKPNTSSASVGGQEKATSDTKDSEDIATSSKSNNGFNKSTSHSDICTKREGEVSDHTSKARNSDSTVICSSTAAGEFLPIFTHSLAAHTGTLLDTFLSKSKGKLPEHLEAVKQDLLHNPFLEQKKLVTARDAMLWEVDKEAYHNRFVTEPQLAGGAFLGNVPSASFRSDGARSQEGRDPPSSKSLQLEKLSPKVALGVPQVPSSDFTAIHYKDSDPPALEDYPPPSKLVLDQSHLNNKSKERESAEQQKSDQEEQSRTTHVLHTLNSGAAAAKALSLQQYPEEVAQWDGGISYHEPKTERMKMDSKTLNEEKQTSQANRKQVNTQPLAEDGGSAYENGPSKWHQTHQQTPANQHFYQSGTCVKKNSQRQEDQTERVKHDYLNLERQSVFQSLETQVPVLVKSGSEVQEETVLTSEKSPAKDHWLIKDEECQDNQSRDCVRGELLKV